MVKSILNEDSYTIWSIRSIAIFWHIKIWSHLQRVKYETMDSLYNDKNTVHILLLWNSRLQKGNM